MEKHTCKLCYRRFSNGRALGGHMRSHVINSGGFNASSSSPAHRIKRGVSSASISASSSEAEAYEVEEAEEEKIYYGLRENPRKSFRVVDPEFAVDDDGGGTVVQDRESETGSRHLPASSVSDTTAEEDVAMSLMMLSRDVWGKRERSEDGGASDGVRPPAKRGRTKFQCGTCKKVFKSYQALGGHRASHKKARGGCAASIESEGHGSSEAAAAIDRTAAVHQCPFCFRVFASGQALGGHKRSHAIAASAAAAAASTSTSLAVTGAGSSTRPAAAENLLDLNLPAPIDDEDLSLSAVSDAEFLHRID
ncbi:Zinc finger protein ZAT9 [Acorus calamus]|uniref:Zinc finger protein ZAT9 n=1 Tax=Acorus calamus TaxID=4465 RepID=A0AAV9FH35_ACOCL|nr:Zinc finger protein ZAT9 [Acorus calamus]